MMQYNVVRALYQVTVYGSNCFDRDGSADAEQALYLLHHCIHHAIFSLLQ